MKVLIIGAAGFVGKYLVKQLKKDYDCSVVVTKMEQETFPLSGVTVCNLDIRNQEAVYALLEKEKPEYVIHLAAQSSVALAWKEPKLTIDVNVIGCVNVLEAIRRSGLTTRILLIGSGEEYGHTAVNLTPIPEGAQLAPGNLYAATKACQNMIGKIYADAYQMDVMMVRAFNHIGPGQSERFVVPDLCKQVAEIEAGKKDPVLYVGNLSAKRDFTDVRDVVRAYSLLLTKGERGETYNVGRGETVAIRELLDAVLRFATCEIKVETDMKKLRPVDVPVIEADITKIYQTVGWRPEIPLEETLQEVLDDWRNQI